MVNFFTVLFDNKPEIFFDQETLNVSNSKTITSCDGNFSPKKIDERYNLGMDQKNPPVLKGLKRSYDDDYLYNPSQIFNPLSTRGVLLVHA